MENPTRLAEAIARLDPESRRFVEVWLAGLGHSDAAKSLGISEQAFVLLRRVTIEKLRELLGEQPADSPVWECN